MGYKCVLLISEDDSIVSQLSELLHGHCNIVSTNSGLEAVCLTRDVHPDVIILSQELPDTHGLYFLSILKRHYPAIPVIFISNLPDQQLKMTALNYGAEQYFVTPLNPERLKKELIKFCDLPPNDFDKVMFPKQRLINVSAGRAGVAQPTERQIASWQSRLVKSIAEQNCIAESIPTHSITESGDNCLKVYFLGNFHLEINGKKYNDWPSKKGKEILAYLFYHHYRRVFRDVLMETFWPGSPPDSARNSLHVTIHDIRHWLQTIDNKIKYVLFKDECYFLNPEIEIWIDVDDFRTYWQWGGSIEQTRGPEAALPYFEKAAALYQGDFIEEELYESWLSLERDHFKEIYLMILEKLSYFYADNGKTLTAITFCERVLRKDNCRENIHRRLMQCYYRLGQRDKAIKQYQKCCKNLQSELDVCPSQQTIQLYKKIKEGDI